MAEFPLCGEIGSEEGYGDVDEMCRGVANVEDNLLGRFR
jgi:hypothetical protein